MFKESMDTWSNEEFNDYVNYCSSEQSAVSVCSECGQYVYETIDGVCLECMENIIPTY